VLAAVEVEEVAAVEGAAVVVEEAVGVAIPLRESR
jgi:hypothetical protein